MVCHFNAEVNILIGKKMRSLRRSLNLSQSALGNKIGVSFQQVQKYEKGINSISASTLYGIAIHLNTPITYFFERPTENNLIKDCLYIEEDKQAFRYEMETPEEQLIASFNQITDKSNQEKILKFLKAVVK